MKRLTKRWPQVCWLLAFFVGPFVLRAVGIELPMSIAGPAGAVSPLIAGVWRVAR